MGFTIEDMHLLSKDRYRMEFVAGKKGWSNSISWVLLLEDTTIIHNFTGRELAVTTGFGFASEEKLAALVETLVEHHATGLIVNVGKYVTDIPQRIITYCDENDFPLLTVPWEVYLAEMIKDLSIRIFLQGTQDEEISRAIIHAVEHPENQELYRKDLLPYMDVEGDFQTVLLTVNGLAEMDTVDRRRLEYRIQIYLENITHNGCFFYYDGNFVLVMNDVQETDLREIVEGMMMRAKQRMPELPLYVGVSSTVRGITKLQTAYRRAKAAVLMAKHEKQELIYFDKMGMYRLVYSVADDDLLKQMSTEPLQVLIDYDEKHGSNYVETFECYLRHNGSIQAISEEMFTHRNTIIYRITNIKKLLNSELETTEERFAYRMAYYIRKAFT